MVRGPFELGAVGEHPTHRPGELGSGRIKEGHVVKTRGVRRRCRTAAAFPGVQAYVMMIAVGRKEHRLRAIALRDFEADRALIKGGRSLEVGDFEMDVAHAEPDRRFLGSHARNLSQTPCLAIPGPRNAL